MTDAPRPDDELASAVVDGVATEQELARAAAEPAVAARVEELRAVRRAVATGIADAPSTDARERAVATALAAATTSTVPVRTGPDLTGPELTGPEPAVTEPAVTDLAPRRAQRSHRRSWVPGAVAAGVVALAGLATFTVLNNRNTNGNSDITAADAPQASTPAAIAGREDASTLLDASATTAGTATTAAGGAGTTVASASGGATTPARGPAPSADQGSAGLLDLGALDTTPALEAAASQLLGAESAVDSGRVLPCETPSGARVAATLTWLGQPGLLLIVDGPPARAVVVQITGCQPVVEVPLS